MRGLKLLLVSLCAVILFGFFSYLNAASLPKEVNVFYPQAGYNISLIKNLEKSLNVKFEGAKWYLNWNTNFTSEVANTFNNNGYLPELTWEPIVNGAGVKYDDVTNGKYDLYINNFAKDVKNFGKPIRIVLAPEMNTNWTPWGYQLQGNTDVSHKAFWRYVVTAFRANGATNAKWVWAPNVIPYGAKYSYAQMYPGDSYVDFTGLEGYNWGTSRSWSVWQSFDEVFYSSYKALAALTSKKILITEIGSTEIGGSKAKWFEEMGQVLRSKYPQVQGFTWFHINKETDWRINSSASSAEAFTKMVNGVVVATQKPTSQTPSEPIAENKSTPAPVPAQKQIVKNDPAPTSQTNEEDKLPTLVSDAEIINSDLPEPKNKLTETIYVSASYTNSAINNPENLALIIIIFCSVIIAAFTLIGTAKHFSKVDRHFHLKLSLKIKHKKHARLTQQIQKLEKQIDSISRKISRSLNS